MYISQLALRIFEMNLKKYRNVFPWSITKLRASQGLGAHGA